MTGDDYTRQGLFKHLAHRNGHALIAHEEMTAFLTSYNEVKQKVKGKGSSTAHSMMVVIGSKALVYELLPVDVKMI